MVLSRHNDNASRLFRKLQAAVGLAATYRRIGTPVKAGATYTQTVLETVTNIQAVRGDMETVEAVLGANATKEVQSEPWELHTADVVGPVTPQDELEVNGTVYEVLAAQQDMLGIRWIMTTRAKAA